MTGSTRARAGDASARDIVLRHHAAYDAQDFETYGATLAEDVELTFDAATLRGRDAVVEFARTLSERFAGVLLDRAIVAEGEDTVVTEARLDDGGGSRPAGPGGAQGLLYQIHGVRSARIVSIRSTFHADPAEPGATRPLLLRDEARRTAGEQAALRRVATLVARGVSELEVFAAVNLEVARLVGADATSLLRFEPDDTVAIVAAWTRRGTTQVVGERRPIDGPLRQARDTRSPTRFGPADLPDGTSFVDEARASGVRSSVGVPIVVDGRVWGMSYVGSTSDEPFPADTEARLGRFTELVATALANAQARADLEHLADEQAALRRVAEAVARGAPPEEVFDLIVREAHGLLGVSFTSLVRFDPDGSSTKVALHDAPEHVYVGQRAPATDDGVVQRVRRTQRPVRVEDFTGVGGELPALARRIGITAAAGAPILVEGQPWGALLAFAVRRRLPPGVEERLDQFAQLAATAVAGAQARSELQALADEQAALRRVAELIAHDAEPERVFDAVAEEASRLLGDRPVALVRFDGDDDGTVVATRDARLTGGGHRYPLEGGIGARIRETGEVALVGGEAGAPVTVSGRVWGMLIATADEAPLPAGTAERLLQFGELLAAAVANAENRAQLRASRARVVASADDARRRLRRDVHDGAQQRLVQTVMTLRVARGALEESSDPTVGPLVREALAHAERASEELRNLVRGILPASLTLGGLRAGIEALADDLPLAVEVDVGSERLPTDLETTAYFVVAEALTNVVKHAGASKAAVRVVAEDDVLVVRVSDDGHGGADPQLGSGLTGLADRVEARDGTLTIETDAGRGTTVTARLSMVSPGSHGRGMPTRGTGWNG